MLLIKCQEQKIDIDFSDERLSMLVLGKSRMGKTFFSSLYGADLIRKNNVVHMIDLGDKWGRDDKLRIGIKNIVDGGCPIYFYDKKSLLRSATYFVNALGYRSVEAVRTVKGVINSLISDEKMEFSFDELLNELFALRDSDKEAAVIYETLENLGEIPKFSMCVDEAKANDMVDTSTIWDFSFLETDYIKVISQVILSAILDVQKARFRQNIYTKKIFVIIDEFQNLDLNQRSIVGMYLTESQKYKLYPILITQFIGKKFSDVIIRQLMQTGIKICFRLEGEEAKYASKMFACNFEEQKVVEKKLNVLENGECFFVGPHRVGGIVTETFRLVRIENLKKYLVLYKKEG